MIKEPVVSRRLAVSLLLVLLTPAIFFPQTSKKKKAAASAARKTANLSHINRAFVASADLKPMAQQLLENRTPQAYAAVQAYARQHAEDQAIGANTEAGALAWLVLGYAHYLDRDFVNARAAWQHTSVLQPMIGDYLDLLRAKVFQEEAQPEAVISTLEGFEQRYPDSLNLHDAQMLYASAVMASGDPKRAAAYLEKHRQPYHADLELSLGRAYEAAGLKDRAVEIFRRLYFDAPLTPEAEASAQELRLQGEAHPAGSFAQRYTRAGMLLKSKRYQDAVNEFSPLVEEAPTGQLTELQIDFAAALYHARKRDNAQHLFEGILQSPSANIDQKAKTLYFLAEIARDEDDLGRHGDLISQLRSLAPASSWFQEALLSAGNMYMLRNDYESAVRFYAEIFERQQNGRFSAYAHWKTGWLTYRMGKKDDAAILFDEQLTLYPSSNEIPAALYWRARIAEEQDKKAIARAYYQKLRENFRHYYYANLAGNRLAVLDAQEAADPTVLDKLPLPSPPPKTWDAPAENLRVQKAQLLANAALYDFAVKELQAAAAGTPPWLAKSLASVYEEQGSYVRAIETMKRTVPNYFSTEIDQLPRPVWAALFPRPFWQDLKRSSLQQQLDPYLVASLIRQESEFNPAAISHASAMGLMQLLPQVGKGLSREMKMGRFSTDDLLIPGTNLQLGTRYFKRIVDHYDGQIEYALAAYNAGENRVEEWRKAGNFKDREEFVESIPFTETREYVQAILRNAVFYKLLYPKD